MFRNNPTGRAAFVHFHHEKMNRLAAAFQVGVPQAVVIRIPNADHYVFRSNPSGSCDGCLSKIAAS